MCIWIYLKMCTYTYACVKYVCPFGCVYLCLGKHLDVHMDIFVCVPIYVTVCPCLWVCIKTCTVVSAQVHIPVDVLCVCTCAHTHRNKYWLPTSHTLCRVLELRQAGSCIHPYLSLALISLMDLLPLDANTDILFAPSRETRKEKCQDFSPESWNPGTYPPTPPST